MRLLFIWGCLLLVFFSLVFSGCQKSTVCEPCSCISLDDNKKIVLQDENSSIGISIEDKEPVVKKKPMGVTGLVVSDELFKQEGVEGNNDDDNANNGSVEGDINANYEIKTGTIFYDRINQNYFVVIEETAGYKPRVAQYDKEKETWAAKSLFYSNGLVMQRGNIDYGHGTVVLSRLSGSEPEIVKNTYESDSFQYIDEEGNVHSLRK